MEYKVYDRFSKRETIPAQAGSKTEPIYEMEIDKNGHKILKKTKRVKDTYSIIQESLEATKIENIIRRATEGDTDILNRMEGQYIDISEFPSGLMQAQNLCIKMKQQFDKLPLEVKQKFDMSPEQYIMQYGNAEWIQKMGIKKETKPEKKKEKEVEVISTDEQK